MIWRYCSRNSIAAEKRQQQQQQHVFDEAREREARAFVSCFFPRKKSLVITDRTRAYNRVPCLLLSLYISVCVGVCGSTFFRPLLSTALKTHGTFASPGGICARTHNTETFSHWYGCDSFRVGLARSGQRLQARG